MSKEKEVQMKTERRGCKRFEQCVKNGMLRCFPNHFECDDYVPDSLKGLKISRRMQNIPRYCLELVQNRCRAGKPIKSELKQAVFERYGKACLVCGRTDKIHLHHTAYLFYPKCDTVDNLVPLCPACHRRVHAYKQKLDLSQQMLKRLLTNMEWADEECAKWGDELKLAKIRYIALKSEIGEGFITEKVLDAVCVDAEVEEGGKVYKRPLTLQEYADCLQEQKFDYFEKLKPLTDAVKARWREKTADEQVCG